MLAHPWNPLEAQAWQTVPPLLIHLTQFPFNFHGKTLISFLLHSQQVGGSVVWGVSRLVIPNFPKEATEHTPSSSHTPSTQQGSVVPNQDKLSPITQCHRLEIGLLSRL